MVLILQSDVYIAFILGLIEEQQDLSNDSRLQTRDVLTSKMCPAFFSLICVVLPEFLSVISVIWIKKILYTPTHMSI